MAIEIKYITDNHYIYAMKSGENILSKRTFTSSNVPVASELGMNLILGPDSEKILAAIRSVAIGGEMGQKVFLTEPMVVQTSVHRDHAGRQARPANKTKR